MQCSLAQFSAARPGPVQCSSVQCSAVQPSSVRSSPVQCLKSTLYLPFLDNGSSLTLPNRYFETITMFVILCNAVTLGMYDPYDKECKSTRCTTLEVAETVIYAFFVFEMTVKITAMGFCGSLGYLNSSWNRLDFFIVCAR